MQDRKLTINTIFKVFVDLWGFIVDHFCTD